jgi:hypothetical protein
MALLPNIAATGGLSRLAPSQTVNNTAVTFSPYNAWDARLRVGQALLDLEACNRVKSADRRLAAADGRVVYADSGLRGYGKLIIVKHNNTFLSAYAHNSEILVKEGQQVTRGQKIAEMGNTDSDQVKLHFEIRQLGKPVDPVKFLPPR